VKTKAGMQQTTARARVTEILFMERTS